MKTFIIAALVAGVASFTGIERAQAQVPARVSGSGASPGTYGTYPSQYPTQYPSARHSKKHQAKKHEQRDRDGGADEARYGTSGQYGQQLQNDQYGQYGQYGRSGTYGYPSTDVPQRVQPRSGYDVYNTPTRVAVPQQAHRRHQDRDNRGHDRDRGDR